MARVPRPFACGRGVIQRLLQAQETLQAQGLGYRLAIFDAWRPIAVQRFMVDYTIRVECEARGFDLDQDLPEVRSVIEEVGRFWAPPSLDPMTPPPHSTGGAVDLTLLDRSQQLVDMGSEIDAIGVVSEPNHYLAVAKTAQHGTDRERALEWHQRRTLLADAMGAAGFAQHPNEWWHFSYGDQLWAWRSGQSQAVYGRSLEG